MTILKSMLFATTALVTGTVKVPQPKPKPPVWAMPIVDPFRPSGFNK